MDPSDNGVFPTFFLPFSGTRVFVGTRVGTRPGTIRNTGTRLVLSTDLRDSLHLPVLVKQPFDFRNRYCAASVVPPQVIYHQIFVLFCCCFEERGLPVIPTVWSETGVKTGTSTTAGLSVVRCVCPLKVRTLYIRVQPMDDKNY